MRSIFKRMRIIPDPQVFWGVVARAQTVDTRPFCLGVFFDERPEYDANYPARACAKGLRNWFCPSVNLSVRRKILKSAHLLG